MNDLRFILFLLGSCLLVAWGMPADAAQAPEPRTFDLYPGDPPGELVFEGQVPDETTNQRGNIRFVHQPTVTVYRPDPKLTNGACVVVCPGGAYSTLAMGHEGHAVADWLNEHGVTTVLLKYRMSPYRHPVPMMDVQRAMQMTRANSEAWGIDPDRIGVLGFSAGGHLASTASTHVLAADPDSDDVVLHYRSRPDFSVLVYPVISLNRSFAHRGSARNLLGPDADAEMLEFLSNDKRVTDKTPPTLLIHSRDDKAVPIENSEVYLAALHAAGVSGTLIEFGTGGHGYGLGRNAKHETAAWPGMCIAWLKTQGLLEAGADADAE